jgi:recombinational DNA repair protein (RecF pathway)
MVQLLTPKGRRSVIAKGVRRERSKLAGGIELFSLCDVVVRSGRVVRSDLGARLVPTVIHQDESVKEALAFDQLVLQYAPHSEATRDLSQAAVWLSKKLAPVFKAQKAVQK